MQTSLRVLAAWAALLATFVLVPTAGAAVKASAALVRAGDTFRLEVTVTSTKAFTAATRPSSAKVGKVSLKRVSSAAKKVVLRSGTLTADVATTLSGAQASIKIKTRGATKTLHTKVAAAPPAPTTPTTPTVPTPPATPGAPPASAPTATRNDAAGQQAMTGNLLLEWSSYGSSGMFAEYRRIWMLSDGTFRLNQVDWNTVSGEKCRTAILGTWTFKEGWTSTEKGGLVLVKIGVNTPGSSGDEVLTFANADANAVYIGGSNPVRYERNPQIMQNC